MQLLHDQERIVIHSTMVLISQLLEKSYSEDNIYLEEVRDRDPAEKRGWREKAVAMC